MSSWAGTEFEKKRQCPSSETLVSYQQRDLTSGQTSQIASHLTECDFCTAELQLLSRYPPAVESYDSPPVPVGLRALAEALLTRNRLGKAKLLEAATDERSRVEASSRSDDLPPTV